MSWVVVLGLVGAVGVPVASFLYGTYRDRKNGQDKRRRQIGRDDADLRDDQREWYERMSSKNDELWRKVEALEGKREADRERISQLEAGRAEDHRTINMLRDYLRRVLAAIPDDVTVPPAPLELRIGD